MSGDHGVLPRVTFVMEQQVGLRTYSDNLRRFVDLDERIEPVWAPITYYQPGGLLERLPLVPSSLTGSIRGWLQVRRALRARADATCFLTQIPLALGGRRSRQRPFVVMMDCTPAQLDRMAADYEMAPRSNRLLATIKHRVNAAGLRAALRVLPMSAWVRSSLIDDYGVDPERTLVLAAGVDLDLWRPASERGEGPMRILFVGGDFRRKGGTDLLEAVDALPPGSAELHVVTRSDVPEQPGVHVHRGLEPNCAELVALFASCEVFVLPSRAEAFPNVVMEACASGLPCIVTDVGAMATMIVEGESGYVVQPGDVAHITSLLASLCDDPETRRKMGDAARRHAEANFDGRANARTVVDLLLEGVAAERGGAA